MNLIARFYPESTFGGFSDVDGTIRFYTRVNSIIRKDDIILDVGCGRGEYQEDNCEYRRNLRVLKGKCKKVIGIDVENAARDNPYIDEFHLIESDVWETIQDSSIDIIVCDYVLEHVQYPEKIFSEFNRVLKNGGAVCARTPNLFSYFGVLSNFTPNRLHAKILARVQDERKPEDVFPKYYHSNSISRIKKLLRRYGFEGVVYGAESEPAYFSFSSIVYGMAKLAHGMTLKRFRTQLYFFARKSKSIKRN